METNKLYQYDELFYAAITEGSSRSARAVLPKVLETLKPTSILDVGCGIGAWLEQYSKLGITDFYGVDGDYVDQRALVIPQKNFSAQDISKPFDLGRKFDLVQCLEVAEHLPEPCSRTLIENITRHGKIVVFSAAVPGQGGENHINEKPYEYWRNLFLEKDYHLFDWIRPNLLNSKQVEFWYRYNMLLFVHRDFMAQLPQQIIETRVNDTFPIRDYSPPLFKLRKTVLQMLPSAFVLKLAVLKHKVQVVRKGLLYAK